jgi:hypothetical protein
MSIEREHETYLDTEETLALFRASKKLFYTSIQPQLRIYRFDGRRKPWYRRRDVEALKSGQSEREAPIVISGIFKNWTEHVRSLGFQIDTKSREIVTTHLPDKAAAVFGIDPEREFVKRGRISFVDQVPICIWDTYYPLDLVGADLLASMKRDEETSVVTCLKERGLIIGWARDRYSARLANFEEQELLRLTRDEPVLILQRASHTRDKKTLILYSHMTLLGSWFAPEHEYKVAVFDEEDSDV